MRLARADVAAGRAAAIPALHGCIDGYGNLAARVLPASDTSLSLASRCSRYWCVLAALRRGAAISFDLANPTLGPPLA